MPDVYARLRRNLNAFFASGNALGKCSGFMRLRFIGVDAPGADNGGGASGEVSASNTETPWRMEPLCSVP
jgi:hypothetical protein